MYLPLANDWICDRIKLKVLSRSVRLENLAVLAFTYQNTAFNNFDENRPRLIRK